MTKLTKRLSLPHNAAWFLLSVLAFHPVAATAGDLPSGTAQGTFTPKGQPPVALAHAAAFVDEKDDRKPVILILSDKKLPTEKWTSEFDLMRAGSSLGKFNGVLFWINKSGEVFRTDMYRAGQQASVGGYFRLKLDSPAGSKELTGSASTKDPDGSDHKLDATFHATLR